MGWKYHWLSISVLKLRTATELRKICNLLQNAKQKGNIQFVKTVLKTKRGLLYLKTQFVPCSNRAVNTFHLGYKNQSVYAVSGTSRCLFSDKYKTHKYSVGKTYSCWMLNCWCITWPVGFKRLKFLCFIFFDPLVSFFSGFWLGIFSYYSNTHIHKTGNQRRNVPGLCNHWCSGKAMSIT